jgi:hypothetical protein
MKSTIIETGPGYRVYEKILKKANGSGTITVRHYRYSEGIDKHYNLNKINEQLNDIKSQVEDKGKEYNEQYKYTLNVTLISKYGALVCNPIDDINKYNKIIDIENIFKHESGGLQIWDTNIGIKSKRGMYKTTSIYGYSVILSKQLRGGFGNQEEINCFYHRIKEAGCKIKTPSLFYYLTNTDANVGIQEHDIKRIEEVIKMNINVVGEYIYQSAGKYKRTVNLKFSGNHYVHQNITENNKELLRSFYKKDRVIQIVDNVKGTYPEYNKTDNENICELQFKKIKKMMPLQNEEISLQDAYNWINTENEKIIKYTNGLINLQNTGIENTIKHMIYKKIKRMGLEFDKIESDEADWINKAIMGSYFYGKELGDYYYDQSSSFAYHLKSMKIPIKREEFKHTTQEEFDEYLKDTRNMPYIIVKGHVKGVSNYFRKELTHFDTYNIKLANKLGLHIILDDDINTLYYSEDKLIEATEIFGWYIDYMYKLKQEHKDSKIIKAFLSHLHGALTQKNKFIYHSKNNEYELIINNEHKVKSIFPKGDDSLSFKCDNIEKPFTSPFGRILPFLLSKQRLWMYSNVIYHYGDKITKMMCDGFYINERIEKFDNNQVKLGSMNLDSKKSKK